MVERVEPAGAGHPTSVQRKSDREVVVRRLFEESDDGPVTTVTFEETEGRTQLTFSERYPTQEALDRNIGSSEGLPEQFAQLETLLSTLE